LAKVASNASICRWRHLANDSVISNALQLAKSPQLPLHLAVRDRDRQQCTSAHQESHSRIRPRSVHPFLHSSVALQTDWLTHHATGSSVAIDWWWLCCLYVLIAAIRLSVVDFGLLRGLVFSSKHCFEKSFEHNRHGSCSCWCLITAIAATHVEFRRTIRRLGSWKSVNERNFFDNKTQRRAHQFNITHANVKLPMQTSLGGSGKVASSRRSRPGSRFRFHVRRTFSRSLTRWSRW